MLDEATIDETLAAIATETLVSPYDLTWINTDDEEYRDLTAGVATLYQDLYDVACTAAGAGNPAESWSRFALLAARDISANLALECDDYAART